MIRLVSGRGGRSDRVETPRCSAHDVVFVVARESTMCHTQVDAFLQSLMDFNGEDIAEDLVKRVQPYLDDPVFSYDKMKSKSAAAANLCAISAF